MCLATVPSADRCLLTKTALTPIQSPEFQSQLFFFFFWFPRFRQGSGSHADVSETILDALWVRYFIWSLWQGPGQVMTPSQNHLVRQKMGIKSKSLMQLCQHSESLQPMFPSIGRWGLWEAIGKPLTEISGKRMSHCPRKCCGFPSFPFTHIPVAVSHSFICQCKSPIA